MPATVLGREQRSGKGVLTGREQAALARVIAEEGRKRYHLVVALSGAHAFGVPPPDSNIDLKAIHIEPTPALLGMASVSPSVDRCETIDGVEVEYSSNEIKPVLIGILHGNGNYVERVLGRLQPHVAKELAELAPLVQKTLSRRLYRHYTGFATSQVHDYRTETGGSLKFLLYVLRTTLTGAHVLATGRVVVNLLDLIDEYGFTEVRELLVARRLGESSMLAPDVALRWETHLTRAFATLETAHEKSVLPEIPRARGRPGRLARRRATKTVLIGRTAATMASVTFLRRQFAGNRTFGSVKRPQFASSYAGLFFANDLGMQFEMQTPSPSRGAVNKNRVEQTVVVVGGHGGMKSRYREIIESTGPRCVTMRRASRPGRGTAGVESRWSWSWSGWCPTRFGNRSRAT